MTKEIQDALEIADDATWIEACDVSEALRTLAAAYRDEKAITDKLPKTADGVSVTLDDVVYDLLGHRRAINHDRYGSMRGYWIGVDSLDARRLPECDRWIVGVLRVDQCYSTREAALATRTQEHADGK